MAQRLSLVPLPLALLAVVLLLSLGARVAWLGSPCRSPCRSADDHLLVFDEVYYVNAARVIAGIPPPADQKYTGTPLGDDPNAEHPQLVKLLVAGSIELLGDRPLAWRLPSLLLGSLAIIGMFVLARAAGGGAWLALAAAGLMAADNLLLVHGRIATLDVPVVALMIFSVALYVRRRPVWAGLLIGVGSCLKLVAPYALLALALLELLRVREVPRVRLARLGACVTSAVAVFIALLAVMDQIAPPYDATSAKVLGTSPFRHLAHMLSYGANQTSPHGARGIASYPWTWLVDFKPITYLNINPARPAPGLYNVHPAAHFLGMISPAIMLLALPALLWIVWEMLRSRGRSPAASVSRMRTAWAGEVPAVALAWSLGTFLPFVVLSLAFERTSYIYYMVVVMPGIYLAVAYLLARARRRRALLALWAVLLLGTVVAMYPFTPVP
ncbi:MAG: glycosyltransferase family 39 protein [Solirubrobacterales bacterium]|nr:glycosyltransferase family 39 protein [Solirubrobacterales bacterium]